MLIQACSACSAAATTATEGREAELQTVKLRDDEESYPICKPEGYRLQGGKGPPRTCETLAGYKDFHDGGGLCSPGRWRKETRELADGANWYWLRREMKNTILEFVGSEKELELEAFRMASGGEANWRVARDEVLRNKLLEILCRWLEAQDLGEKDLDRIVEGQPLRLKLLRRLLEGAGDPDREFRREADEGPPVRIRYPLPRTPHVFEEQLRWPLDNHPWEPGLRWVRITAQWRSMWTLRPNCRRTSPRA